MAELLLLVKISSKPVNCLTSVMEYFIHNMNTIETKTSEEQETKMSSMDT